MPRADFASTDAKAIAQVSTNISGHAVTSSVCGGDCIDSHSNLILEKHFLKSISTFFPEILDRVINLFLFKRFKWFLQIIRIYYRYTDSPENSDIKCLKIFL